MACRARVCHSSEGLGPGFDERESRFEPHPEKTLDTAREKHILIEDIVVDNPREGSMSDRLGARGQGMSLGDTIRKPASLGKVQTEVSPACGENAEWR